MEPKGPSSVSSLASYVADASEATTLILNDSPKASPVGGFIACNVMN
jgi:hypothetical protein